MNKPVRERTTRRQVLLGVILLMVVFCLISAGCHKPKNDSDVDWELSPEARTTYLYLLLEDAKSAQNATIGEYALEELLKLDPTPTIIFEAASFFWQSGRLAKTRDVLLLGLEKHPGHVEMMLMLAQVYLKEKKFKEAIETIKGYLEKNPLDYYTRQELAGILVQNEQYEDGLSILKQIPQKERTPVIQYFEAKCLVGMKKFNEAEKLLKKAVQEAPGLIEAWAELAYLYELTKNFAAAERTYTKILNMGDQSKELIFRLVEINLKLKKPDKALSLVQKGPDDLGFLITAATQFLDQGFFPQAEKILTPIAADKPAFKEVHFYLAVLAYEWKKDKGAAERHLAEIPESNRFHERALRFRIHILFEDGEQEKAAALAAEGRKLYPGQKDFWILEARMLEERDKFDQAVSILEQAIEKWPQDPEILFTLGVVLDKANQHDRSFEVMEKTILLDPEHADALNYVGYTLADKGKDLERAYALITKALNLKPDNGYIMDSMAWVEFRLGRKDSAWTRIKAAVELAKDDPVIWEHYGDIASAVGRKDEAATGYRKSLQFKPKDREKVQKKLDSL